MYYYNNRLYRQKKQNEDLQRRILEETEKIQRRLLEEEEEREKEQLRRAILQKQLEIERCQQEMQTSSQRTEQVDLDYHSRKRDGIRNSQESLHFEKNDVQRIDSDQERPGSSTTFNDYSPQLVKEIPRGLFSHDSLTLKASKVNPFTQESTKRRDTHMQRDSVYTQELEKFVNQDSHQDDRHSSRYGQKGIFSPPSQTEDKWEGFSLSTCRNHPPDQDGQHAIATSTPYNRSGQTLASQDKWEGFSMPKKHPPIQDSQQGDTRTAHCSQFNPPEYVTSQDKWERGSLPRRHQDHQQEGTPNSLYGQFSQVPEHVAPVFRKHSPVENRTPIHHPSTTPPEPDSMTSPKSFRDPKRDDSDRNRKARVTPWRQNRQTISERRKSASSKGLQANGTGTGNRDHGRSTQVFSFNLSDSTTIVTSSSVDSPMENSQAKQTSGKTHQLKSLLKKQEECDPTQSSYQSHKDQKKDTPQPIGLDDSTHTPVSPPLKRKIKLSRSWKRKSIEDTNPAPQNNTGDTSPAHTTDSSENNLMIDIRPGTFESSSVTVPDSSQLDNEDAFEIHPETPEYDEYLDESSSLGGVFARLGKRSADDNVREIISNQSPVVVQDGMANKRRMFTVAQPLPTWNKPAWRGFEFDSPCRYYRYQ